VNVEERQAPAPVYVIGDVHGEFRQLQRLLRRAEIIDHHHNWSAGNASLWFLGDLVDRGPDGIAVIDLVMRLQKEAAACGGLVNCLLGNHELMLLAAYRFGRRSTGLGSSFITRWRRNGGQRKDLAGLTTAHLDWLMHLPVMVCVQDSILVHADSTIYLKRGRSIDQVNEAFRGIMKHSDVLNWEELIEEFGMRGIFYHRLGGDEYIERFLSCYEGKRIVHGHTPISYFSNQPAKKITEAFIYAQDRCIDVDGGMFLGGAGVIYQLPQYPAAIYDSAEKEKK
jgi:hypothetical protein